MIPEAKLSELAKELRGLKDEKEAAENALKDLNKQIGALESQTIPDLMKEHEIEKIAIEGFGTLYLQRAVRAYVYAEDKEKAFAELKSMGFGDIIKETIHWATLNSWAKEQMEEGNPVPDIFNAKPVTFARIRRK